MRALRAGDARALGALMREAQARFDRDVAPACPSQLTMPLLHALLDHPPFAPLVWGGKGVGSQGDGTAQVVWRALARSSCGVCRASGATPSSKCHGGETSTAPGSFFTLFLSPCPCGERRRRRRRGFCF